MVSELLCERGSTHGQFSDNARIGQHLRAYWRAQPTWDTMPEQQREALDHIAGKLSRIFSGQSTHRDHWRDVQGYALLAENACPEPFYPRSSGVVGSDGNYHI